MKNVFLLGFLCLFFIPFNTVQEVDSINGNDQVTGLTEQTPIQSLERLNQISSSPGDSVRFKTNSIFRGWLQLQSGTKNSPILYSTYGNGKKPVFLGSVLSNETQPAGNNIYIIGNYVEEIGLLQHTENGQMGIPKSTFAEMNAGGHFYHDRGSGDVYLYSNSPPGEYEMGITKDVISLDNISYVTIEELEVTLGSAHGIAGDNTRGIIIRNCRIQTIGGGFLRIDVGFPLRYGNGIEFWSNARDNLVENCEIFNIFDTGVTNQGSAAYDKQINITYRNNHISECGMASYELWLQGNFSSMKDITFEGNSCLDAGAGFSLEQERLHPEGLGFHIASYGQKTPLDNILIKDNQFSGNHNSEKHGAVILMTSVNPARLNELDLHNNSYTGYDYFSIIIDKDGEVLVQPIAKVLKKKGDRNNP